ncbi:3'-5' exonuclease [Ilumatobacter sp.]|uniref:3'-5' exonuclease n=1 Tax=Ilumatobacter sp. TaxID=1967498 RepID=UPI003C55187E
MALPDFAVVDVETSGLNVRRHRVLQLAVITVDAEGNLVDEWDTFVKLRWPLSRVGPTHVHGITRPMLRGAPKLDAVLGEFAERVGDSLFVAHNAQFDGEFLLRAARRSGRPESELASLERRLCTLRMSRRLDPDRVESHRLGDLCDRYGVPLLNPHEAKADARATAAVLPHLLRAHGITDEAELEPFLDGPRLPASDRSGQS